MGLHARCHVSFLLYNLMEIYAHRKPLNLASVFVRSGLRRQPGGTDGRAAATHPQQPQRWHLHTEYLHLAQHWMLL